MPDIGLSQIMSAITNVAKIGINVISQNQQGTGTGYYTQGMELSNGQPAIIAQTQNTDEEILANNQKLNPAIIISMVGITALAIGFMIFINKK